MSTAELKSDLSKMLENIDDEQLLRTIYEFLKQGTKEEEGRFWKTLTEDQKRRVYESYEQSKDDKKLIAWDTIKKKY
ncbi:MAG: hypothetical protein JST14_15630 [Bacteroidetes bacterium]|nr:hypothetical protein [Bacteroidota bacterium]MBS1975951.1 hypothetical protein [Bacteroidota bacterium]